MISKHFPESLGYDLSLMFSSEAQKSVDISGIGRNIKIIERLIKAHNAIEKITSGHFFALPCGQTRRVTKTYDDVFQVTSYEDSGVGDNFYLYDSGFASYSGGLSSTLYRKSEITEDKPRLARFWCFEGNWPRASGGMSFLVMTKAWKIK